MIFKGINNQSVEFKITNYQFPQNKEGDWDGNWLLIYLKVQSELGDWQTIDPSLTTWDVSALISWIQSLSLDKEPEENPLTFVEPNLSFAFYGIRNDKKRVRIRFNAESRPKSALDTVKYFVDCDYTTQELEMIAEELKKELEKYPERKEVDE